MGGEQQPPPMKWMNWEMVFETIDCVVCGRSVDSVEARFVLIGYEWGGVELMFTILKWWLIVRMWGVGMECDWDWGVWEVRWEWKGRREVIVMKDRTVSQFHKHLITIKSHIIIILMECFKLTFIFHKEQSLSQTTSFKITQKEKGRKDMEVWWMIVIVCGSVVQLGICDDFEKVWKHIGRQKQGIDGDGREKWCDTDRNDVKIRVVCGIYD